MKVTKYSYPTPLSIALLSDMHNCAYEEITEQIEELQPDIIAITGDVILGGESDENDLITTRQKNVLPFLTKCAGIAPTFFSFGNHERALTDGDIKNIKLTGVCILDNTFTVHNGMVIGGLSSAQFTERNSDPAERNTSPQIDWLNEFEEHQGFKLLLCHHPEYRDLYLNNRMIDLILCGHCHGGQIRLFDRGLFAPGQGILPYYTKGIYGNMIISTGLSNTAFPIPRLFNPCEIVFIESKHSFAYDSHTSVHGSLRTAPSFIIYK